MNLLLILVMAIKFTQPIDFTEALESRQVRSILRTDLSSAEIRDALDQDFIDRAIFSARVTNAEILQTIDDITLEIVNGKLDLATARLRLQKAIAATGYQPAPDDRDTLKDLSSQERIDLIIRTNAQIAQGYGQFTQSNTYGALVAFPAQELFRLQRRKHERGTTKGTIGWQQRWQEAGGKLSGERMIARKDDRVWARLGTMWDDSLGNPYPPFAFNSGMWVKPVSRAEAVKFGIVEQNTRVTPQSKGFNDDLRFTPAVRSAALQQALLDSLGPDYQLKDGVLTRR